MKLNLFTKTILFSLVIDTRKIFKYNSTTSELIFTGLDVTSIPSSIFYDYKHAKVITIKNTSITEIPSGLEALQNKFMFLYLNNTKTVNYNNLEQALNLTTLILEHNGTASIQISGKNLVQLNSVSLSGNNLTQIPEFIFNCDNLQVLNLSKNEINSIPNQIKNLTNLVGLNLGNNKLKELNINLAHLQNLKHLSLKYNSFLCVPYEICVLSKLKFLDLTCNNIKSIATDIDIVSFYEKLTLSQLSTQSSSLFTKVSSFIKCYLSYYCEAISFDYLELTKEECIVLLHYKLQTIEKGLYNLTNLETLCLANNKIQEIPTNITEFKLLNYLDLSYNKIIVFTEELLHLKNLKVLDLSDNNLILLPYNFISFNNLEKINLQNNLISKTETDELKGSFQYKKTNINDQYDIVSTIMDILNIKKHCNEEIIFDINHLKVNNNIVELSSNISDLSMIRMWNTVLKHILNEDTFAINRKDLSFNDLKQLFTANSNYLCEYNVEVMINIIQPLILSDAKSVSIANPQDTINDIIRRMTLYLEYIATNQCSSKDINSIVTNIEIKAYVKVLFCVFIKDLCLAQQKLFVIENVRNALAELCKFCLNHDANMHIYKNK